MSLNYVDSHCHLDMLDLSEFDNHMDNVIALAKQNQVSNILSIAVDLDSFPRVLDTARNYSNVHASVGLHPCHSPENSLTVGELVTLADDENVIAIGETGLDYYMNNGSDPLEDNFSWQRERFRTHIRTAVETSKPLIIHTRDARDDTLRILEEENADKIGGIMHCFVEDLETAEKALDMGFYISFSGIVTFKNAGLNKVVMDIPLEKILLETDSPYLTPTPFRGQRNESSYLVYIARKIAEIKELTLEDVALETTKSSKDLFAL